MIAHITYTDYRMSKSAELARTSALKYGCETSRICNVNDIDPYFKLTNYEILQNERGAGFWLWKPYIILKELCRMNDGDYLIYTDAGVEVVSDLKAIINVNVCNPVLLFGNNYNHDHWCKMAITMEIYGGPINRAQVQASAMVFKVCEESRNLVKRWLLWCQMPGFIDDSPMQDNDPEFQEHRHDQAVLTCLAYRYNYPLHWWPAMYNDGAFHYEKVNFKDDYPIIFHHHRKRNEEWK